MQFIKHTTPKILIADEGKKIRDVNDIYIKKHFDEEGNIAEAHKPYYSDMIFVSSQIESLEECQKLYVEEVPTESEVV